MYRLTNKKCVHIPRIGVALSYGGGVLKLSIPAHRSKEGLCATNQQNK